MKETENPHKYKGKIDPITTIMRNSHIKLLNTLKKGPTHP